MSSVLDRSLAEHLSAYARAIVSFLDPSGYPVNVATAFQVDASDGVVYLDPFDAPDEPPLGAEVELTFSHVRPRPGIGYDQRRYVNLWGTLSRRGSRLAFTPHRSSGWDESRMPFVEYCERNLARAHNYLANLSLERAEPVGVRLPLRWRLFLATRVPFLTATLVPVALGAMVARAHGHSAWWSTAAALIGAAWIHLGLNVLNDIYDIASGADSENLTPTPFSGGSRVQLYGLASNRFMWTLAGMLFTAGCAIGVYLAFARSLHIFWLGIVGVTLSIFYTAPPIKLVYRGLGDVAVAAGFGPVMTLGSYAVAAQGLSVEAFYASLPVGIFAMLILYVNQIPDRQGDARAGKRTIAVRAGAAAVIRGYDMSVVVGFALIVLGTILDVLPVWTLIAVVASPLAIRVHRGLRTSYDAPYGLVPALGANIAMHLLAGLGLVGGYIVHTVLG